MRLGFIGLILVSIALSSGSQLILKMGMSSPSMQSVLQGSPLPRVLVAIATSPAVLSGLFCFGLSAVVWLFVLSKVPVSTAYPFVALGIVMTALGGRWLFGEPFSVLKLIGVALIVLGIGVISISSFSSAAT